MNRPFRMKKLCLSAVLLTAAVGARGAFVEESASFGPGLTDFTETLTLRKFDPNLGELSRVTYTLDVMFAGEISTDSENPSPRTVTLEMGGRVALWDGVETLLELSPAANSGPLGLDPDNDAFADFVGTDAATFPTVLEDTASRSGVDTPTLSWFTATFLGETFDWQVDAQGFSAVLGSGNLAVTSRQFASGQVTVRYEYNAPIPETSTYLSAFGLLGIAALAGRRCLRR